MSRDKSKNSRHDFIYILISTTYEATLPSDLAYLQIAIDNGILLENIQELHELNINPNRYQQYGITTNEEAIDVINKGGIMENRIITI